MADLSTVRAAVATGDGRVAFKDVVLGRSASVVAVVPVTDLRGPTGLILTATEVAGSFNLNVATNVLTAKGEVTDNETEASICLAAVVLPSHYTPGTDLTVRIPCALVASGSPTNNGSTVDLSVYKQAAGAVSADLVSTAAQTFAALDTWYDKDFTVVGTTLSPGDRLVLKVTSNIIDSEAGAGTITFTMDALSLLGTTNT